MIASASRKILLVNRCSPGDVLMVTAAVRDLHRAYPGRFETAVDTCCPDIWQHNPYITEFDRDSPDVIRIDCGHPPMLDRCNGQPRHYIESVHDALASTLRCPIPLGRFGPDLHLSADERKTVPFGIKEPYWVVVAGGKHDLTTKWWPSSSYQRVVDTLRARTRFVQVGTSHDHHPPLTGVTNLIGRTSLRELIQLIYHADGVLCATTCSMHVAAAFDRPCVVVAGGREPPHWEMYPGHQYLHTVGQLNCCRSAGCWKARVRPLGDGDADRDNNLCELPMERDGQPVAACMSMIEPEDVVRAIRRYDHDVARANPPLTAATASRVMQQAARAIGDYPDSYEGRGIVIPGGGFRYFTCAWVCVKMLRHVGCDLPIELWHLGDTEMTNDMRRLADRLGVRCVDGHHVRERHPVRRLGGWELKAYAVIHSRFREVLLLDADNVPVRDPESLFECEPYRETGAVFWPDYGRLTADRAIWRLTGIDYVDEPEFESGQIVVDKQRCWRPLNLAMWMNEHSDFWYDHIHGDKDTFHMAWRKIGAPYAMVPYPIRPLPSVMVQHDFHGQPIFQHRNLAKWTLGPDNPTIPGFVNEDLCRNYLGELRRLWPDHPGRAYDDSVACARARRAARELCDGAWIYRRVGYDERSMSFDLSGRVVQGSAANELAWDLRVEGDQPVLRISNGRDQMTCQAVWDGDRWVGRWLVFEKMPLELVRHAPVSS